MDADDWTVIIILILLFYFWQKQCAEELKKQQSSSGKRRTPDTTPKVLPLEYNEKIEADNNEPTLKREIKAALQRKKELAAEVRALEAVRKSPKVTKKEQSNHSMTRQAGEVRDETPENEGRALPKIASDATGAIHDEHGKLKKQRAEGELEEEGDDANIAEMDKRKMQEAPVEKKSSAVGDELSALKRRKEEVTPSATQAKVEAVDTPDKSPEPSSDKRGENAESKRKAAAVVTEGEGAGIEIEARKLARPMAEGKKEEEGVNVKLAGTNERKIQEAADGKDSAAIGANLIALKRREPQAAPRVPQEAVAANIENDALKMNNENKGLTQLVPSEAPGAMEGKNRKKATVGSEGEAGEVEIEARKLEKQAVEMKKEEQGVDINLAEANKRKGDEAAAEKDSAAVGADLVALKRRNAGTPADSKQSELTEVNLSNDLVQRKGQAGIKARQSQRSASDGRKKKHGKSKSKEDMAGLPAEGERTGVDIAARKAARAATDVNKVDQGVDVNLNDANKRRKQETAAEKESAAVAADLVALKRRTPEAAAGSKQSELVEVNIPNELVERKGLAGRKKIKSQPSTTGEKGKKHRKSRSKEKIAALPAEDEAEGINIEARKLVRQETDMNKEEQGVDVNLADANKRRKQETAAEKESAAVAADLIALKRRTPEAAAGGKQSELVEVNIPNELVERKGQAGRKERRGRPSAIGGKGKKHRKSRSKEKTAELPAEDEAEGINIEARKQVRQETDLNKEEQGVDVNLANANKRRKQETAAEKESAAVAADLIALKRRTPEAAAGGKQSELVEVNIPNELVERKGQAGRMERKGRPSAIGGKGKKHRKSRSKEKTAAPPAEDEAEGLNIGARKLVRQETDMNKEEQGVDVNLAEANKRRKQETAAEKESAAVAADLIALKRRTPEAAAGGKQSELVEVNIPNELVERKGQAGRKERKGRPSAIGGKGKKHRKSESKVKTAELPADDEAEGINIEARKQVRQETDLNKEEQGVDVNLANANKRRKQETAAEKESAAVAADLIALKRRTPEAAAGGKQSELVEVNIPDELVERKGQAGRKERKGRPSAIGGKGKKHRKSESKVKTAELPADDEAEGVDIEARKLVRQETDLNKEEQGVDVNLANANKRRRQEAAAGKDSAVIGAELIALKTRRPEAAVAIMHSEVVEANLPSAVAHANAHHDEGVQMRTPPLHVPEGGLGAAGSPSIDALHGGDRSPGRSKRSVRKRRGQGARATVDDASVAADLLALVKRSPGTHRVSGSHAIGIDLPDDVGEADGMEGKGANKDEKKKVKWADDLVAVKLISKKGKGGQGIVDEGDEHQLGQIAGGMAGDREPNAKRPVKSHKRKGVAKSRKRIASKDKDVVIPEVAAERIEEAPEVAEKRAKDEVKQKAGAAKDAAALKAKAPGKSRKKKEGRVGKSKEKRKGAAGSPMEQLDHEQVKPISGEEQLDKAAKLQAKVGEAQVPPGKKRKTKKKKRKVSKDKEAKAAEPAEKHGDEGEKVIQKGGKNRAKPADAEKDAAELKEKTPAKSRRKDGKRLSKSKKQKKVKGTAAPLHQEGQEEMKKASGDEQGKAAEDQPKVDHVKVPSRKHRKSGKQKGKKSKKGMKDVEKEPQAPKVEPGGPKAEENAKGRSKEQRKKKAKKKKSDKGTH